MPPSSIAKLRHEVVFEVTTATKIFGEQTEQSAAALEGIGL
jgi:hypothetical protein